LTVLFYRWAGDASPPRTEKPNGVTVRVWRPSEQGLPPPGSRGRASNWVWWAFEALGLFAEPGFTELTLWRDGRRLHRQIATPRWCRFPFMGRGDLQLGDLRTEPEARGQGLARAAIAEALRLARHADQVWYLVDARNAASVRLAESAGFQLHGVGRRTRPLGLHAAGRFRLDRT